MYQWHSIGDVSQLWCSFFSSLTAVITDGERLTQEAFSLLLEDMVRGKKR